MWTPYIVISLFYAPPSLNGLPLHFNLILPTNNHKQWQQYSLIQILKLKY